MDEAKRQALIHLVEEQGFEPPGWARTGPLPIVSLEDFFEGNDEETWFDYETFPQEEFYECLCRIRGRDDVAAVWVEIFEIFKQRDVWPLPGAIYIVTSADRESVREWGVELLAENVVEGWAYGHPPAAPEIPEGYRVWQILMN